MNKLFSIICLSCALSYVNTAQAYWWCPPWNWEGNFLVGASAGYGERLGPIDITLVYTSPLQTIPSSFLIEDYTDKGFIGGFFAGYQVRYQRFVFGGEFNIDWDNMTHDHFFAIDDANAQVGVLPGFGYSGLARYQREPTIGLSARIGYEITRCFMPYIRLGLEQSDDKLIVAYAGNPAIYNFSVVTEGEHRQLRYVLGIGTEVPLPIFSFIGIRFEYDFHSRGKTSEALGIINDGLGFNPFFMNKINTKTHTGKLSIVWNI